MSKEKGLAKPSKTKRNVEDGISSLGLNILKLTIEKES